MKQNLENVEPRTLTFEEEFEVMKTQLISLTEKLYFSEKECEHLRMATRAARLERDLAWETIYRYEKTISQVPWDVVAAWRLVRRAIPTSVLRMIDRIRNLLRQSRAN